MLLSVPHLEDAFNQVYTITGIANHVQVIILECLDNIVDLALLIDFGAQESVILLLVQPQVVLHMYSTQIPMILVIIQKHIQLLKYVQL